MRQAGVALILALAGCVCHAQETAGAERKIEIVADHDYRFKLPDQKQQILRLKANEPLLLLVTAHAGEEMAQDGAVHSLVIRSQRSQGWDIRLKEGQQALHLRAPAKPGNYLIECTVRCGGGHDNMKLKVVVEP
jgi:hypothetical protein